MAGVVGFAHLHVGGEDRAGGRLPRRIGDHGRARSVGVLNFELGLEGRVASGLVIGDRQLLERSHEGFRNEHPSELAEVAGGVKHVVAKGETLTSIAKQYNIPINDLKTANKIENERKLQIGQVLILPTPKTPDTSDKKENP